MNNIVYTCTGRIKQDYRPEMHDLPRTDWQEEVRRTPRECRDANNALNIEYRRRALAVGMTLEAYCNRFNIKLK